jgi:putative ABC transport system permease protein
MTRLALGIGVLALGIIGLRAAVERKVMLGTLRALGYRRRTVGVALLAEAAVVTTAGTLVGAGGGLLLNRVFFGGGASSIDLASLGGTVLVTYIAALLVAAGPALRASRVPPAEAVRSVD